MTKECGETPRGRPPLPSGEARRRRNIHLSDQEWELAVDLGDGNGAEGIRYLLRRARIEIATGLQR